MLGARPHNVPGSGVLQQEPQLLLALGLVWKKRQNQNENENVTAGAVAWQKVICLVKCVLPSEAENPKAKPAARGSLAPTPRSALPIGKLPAAGPGSAGPNLPKSQPQTSPWPPPSPSLPCCEMGAAPFSSLLLGVEVLPAAEGRAQNLLF